MAAPRYLCSHLVRLQTGDRVQWVNLEEIWRDGAILECEDTVGAGVQAKISTDDVAFLGHVADVRQHDFGWSVEFAFSPLTPWSADRWTPEHMLDPTKARAQK